MIKLKCNENGKIETTLRRDSAIIERYGVGCVRTGNKGRKENGGPLIPGPWAYMYRLGNVIDQTGGSGRESRDRLNEGTEKWFEHGDLIEIDGVVYTMVRAYNENTDLVPLPDKIKVNIKAHPEVAKTGHVNAVHVLHRDERVIILHFDMKTKYTRPDAYGGATDPGVQSVWIQGDEIQITLPPAFQHNQMFAEGGRYEFQLCIFQHSLFKEMTDANWEDCTLWENPAVESINKHRLNPSNPLEQKFVAEWEKINEEGKLLRFLLDRTHSNAGNHIPTTEEQETAVTLIQWLGSPVGQGFLQQCADDE